MLTRIRRFRVAETSLDCSELAAEVEVEVTRVLPLFLQAGFETVKTKNESVVVSGKHWKAVVFTRHTVEKLRVFNEHRVRISKS